MTLFTEEVEICLLLIPMAEEVKMVLCWAWDCAFEVLVPKSGRYIGRSRGGSI